MSSYDQFVTADDPKFEVILELTGNKRLSEGSFYIIFHTECFVAVLGAKGIVLSPDTITVWTLPTAAVQTNPSSEQWRVIPARPTRASLVFLDDKVNAVRAEFARAKLQELARILRRCDIAANRGPDWDSSFLGASGCNSMSTMSQDSSAT